MDKSEKLAVDGHSCNNSSGSAAVGLEKLLLDTCEKLENQQKWQHQNFQSLRELFEQQLQNQFQHLQQQQESQFKILQQQMKQQESQFKLLQQQIQQQSNQKNELQEHDVLGQRDLTRKPEGNLDEAVQDMKDKFLEMKNTVLNQLEEESVLLRESLSKAQNDILNQLSKTGEDVIHVKEVVETDALARMENQLGQVQTQQKKVQEDQRDTAEGGSQQISQDLLKTLVEDLETCFEDKLEYAVGSLKKELQEIKENNVPIKVLDIKSKDDSKEQPDKGFSYYVYINSFFEKCVCGEQCIENTSMYVDKLRTSVRGYIQFVNGDMEVFLKRPDNLGKTEVTITVTIVDVTENLPAKEIAQKKFSDSYFAETRPIQPILIGSVRCDKVMKDGYDLYKSGAVLLRYDIFVKHRPSQF